MSPQMQTKLYERRNKIVAQSFYRQLQAEGFSAEQIIELSTTLLDLVTTDLKSEQGPKMAPITAK